MSAPGYYLGELAAISTDQALRDMHINTTRVLTEMGAHDPGRPLAQRNLDAIELWMRRRGIHKALHCPCPCTPPCDWAGHSEAALIEHYLTEHHRCPR